MDQWYVHTPNEVLGPYSVQELLRKYQTNDLSSTALVIESPADATSSAQTGIPLGKFLTDRGLLASGFRVGEGSDPAISLFETFQAARTKVVQRKRQAQEAGQSVTDSGEDETVAPSGARMAVGVFALGAAAVLFWFAIQFLKSAPQPTALDNHPEAPSQPASKAQALSASPKNNATAPTVIMGRPLAPGLAAKQAEGYSPAAEEKRRQMEEAKKREEEKRKDEEEQRLRDEDERERLGITSGPSSNTPAHKIDSGDTRENQWKPAPGESLPPAPNAPTD